jgi:hypothetical protein
MAGSSVHLHATTSSAGTGSLDESRIEWDFGNPDGRYNKLVGYNAGHLYEEPGTYTATLRIWNRDRGYDEETVTVNVAPDTRQTIFVAPWGSDSNNGMSSNSPLRTLERASERLWEVGDNTQILLQRGGVYEVDELVYLDRNNVVLGAYGNGDRPVIRWTNSRWAPNNKTVIWFDTDRSQFTVRDVEFDQTYDDTNGNGMPGSLQPSGKGIAVVDNIFRDVGDAVVGSGQPEGILVMNNVVPSETDLRRYFTWIEGSDWTVVGNDVPNSTREHIIRLGNGKRVNVHDNDLANLDRRPQGDQWDFAKGVINVQKGSYAYVSGNRTHGPSGVGPLGAADGLGDTGARFEHAVFEGNLFNNGQFLFEHGAHNIEFRSNVIDFDGQTAIEVDGWDSQYDRRVRDITIANNTVINNSSIGKFARIWAGGQNVVVTENLYVAPNLYVGPYGTSVLRVDADNLGGFSKIDNNVWADAEVDPWAGGVIWVGRGSDNSGFVTQGEWNAFSQVGNDRFSDVGLDAQFRPAASSVAADNGKARAGVLVDFNGDWRDDNGSRSIGAVER